MGGFAGLDGVGWEKSVRRPSTIGPKLLFAPHGAFELDPKPNPGNPSPFRKPPLPLVGFGAPNAHLGAMMRISSAQRYVDDDRKGKKS